MVFIVIVIGNFTGKQKWLIFVHYCIVGCAAYLTQDEQEIYMVAFVI